MTAVEEAYLRYLACSDYEIKQIRKQGFPYAEDNYFKLFKSGYEYGRKYPLWHHTRDGEFPHDACSCLVRRNRFGETWTEIICYDGKYWVTGLNDDPDAVIEAWIDLRELEE